MDITNYKHWLNDPEVLASLSWIGTAIAVLGFVFAYYFYVKSKRTKQPYCITFSSAITGKVLRTVPDLELTYKKRPINNLALTKLVFWNAGAETIHSSDIPEKSPFLIKLNGDAKILNCNLEFVKKEASAIAATVAPAQDQIMVTFDYLDRNDGFVLELLHTGESDKSVEVCAVFKGADPLVHRNAAAFLSLPSSIQRVLASEHRSFLGILMILFAAVSALDYQFHFLPNWIAPTRQSAFDEYAAQVIIFGGLAALGIYLFRTRLPKGFDIRW